MGGCRDFERSVYHGEHGEHCEEEMNAAESVPIVVEPSKIVGVVSSAPSWSRHRTGLLRPAAAAGPNGTGRRTSESGPPGGRDPDVDRRSSAAAIRACPLL